MTEEQLEKHKIAAKKLGLIKDKVFSFIKQNINKVSEYDVNKFISSEFKKQRMITQKEYPVQIIGFGQNTSFVHYYPKASSSKIIEKDSLVLIDIWAKLNEKDAPFADITWMGYTGKNVPKEIRRTCKLVIGARDEVIKFIKKNLKDKRLPNSVEIEKTARSFFDNFNVEEFFTHGVGHSLGITQDHGT
ncbi:MAG: M24 family metallopeptidase, partial [bacterium]|nr:M24 family metallopeptidase [bacterium]